MGRFALRLFLGLWLAVSALHAQETIDTDLERWQTIATRAEAAIDSRQGSDSFFESLRSTVADYRKVFDAGRDLNKDRIQTLRNQLAAIGPEPESGTEAADVTAKRADLNKQLAQLLVPVQTAQSGFVRADAIVSQIDRILRERQADELLKITPSPLNLGLWQPAITDLASAAELIWIEDVTADAPRSWSKLRESLPLVIVLTAMGTVLLLRGRRWSHWVAVHLQSTGARSFGIWRFLVSLLRIILPFAGASLLALAAVTSALFGTKGDNIILVMVFLGGIMLAVRWVADRVFSRDDDEALIPLPQDKRSKIRFYVNLITVMIICTELVTLVLDAGYPQQGSKGVLTFPFFLVSSIALFHIGVLLRSLQEPPEEEEVLADVRSSTKFRLIRSLGTASVVVACLAPVLLAAGYFNAADGLLPPFIMTLALLGLVMTLQRFSAEVYGALTGQGSQARDALIPVLIGALLVVLIAPVVALIWGARVTDLTELWTAFGRGFAIGDSRISPTDFLAFAVIFAIGYLLTRLVQSSLRTNILPKTHMDVGAQNAIVSGLGYVGIFLAALAAITGAGIDLSSLAIVAGALSVGIGFGLQNIVSNFVSGIILLIERPISEGDWIEVGGKMGYVRDISVRSTRIETFDKTDVIVPNADLVSGTVTNYTRGNTVGRLIVPIGVAYGTDTKRVEAILREIAEAQPMVLNTPPPSVLFVNFGADALEFEMRCFLRDVNWMMAVKSDINHAVAARFNEENIEIPFAQRDVWLRNPEVLRHTADDTPPAEDDTAKEQPA